MQHGGNEHKVVFLKRFFIFVHLDSQEMFILQHDTIHGAVTRHSYACNVSLTLLLRHTTSMSSFCYIQSSTVSFTQYQAGPQRQGTWFLTHNSKSEELDWRNYITLCYILILVCVIPFIVIHCSLIKKAGWHSWVRQLMIRPTVQMAKVRILAKPGCLVEDYLSRVNPSSAV